MPVVIAKLKLQSVIISIDLINRKKFDNTNNMMLTFKQNYKLLFSWSAKSLILHDIINSQN